VRLEDGTFAPYERAFVEVEGRLEMAAEAADAGGAPPPDETCVQVLTGLLPAQVEDASAGPRLIVPLVLKGEAEGYIDALGLPGRPFGHEQVELVQILANQAAVAVENARLYRTIERQAITDGLTGLYNHRYFYERLFQEFARAQRYGAPLSLLMIDIDDFKRFNDRYGHPVGDDVLAAVADILVGQLRRHVDLAARYGGEEFVVLLPNTPREGAQIVGDRLKQHVAALMPGVTTAADTSDDEAATAVGGDESAAAPAVAAAGIEGARLVGERIRRDIAEAPFGAPGEAGHVTVSIGVAMFPESASNPDELVRSADKALYLAKRLGKDRVEVFEAR
jgi:diguanylate cyclase (GGDEF)-like protein